MNDLAPAEEELSSAGRSLTVAALVAVVIGIIGVAFRGSWGALRDAALAAHFDRTGADLYPFAVDGLLIVAILSAVLLRHDRGARRYCLTIIGSYTGASWLINFLHGLGLFSPDPVTHRLAGPPWYVVLVIASLVIGSIFLGSHLLIYVWRHIFPDATPAGAALRPDRPVTKAGDDVPPVPELPPYGIEAAKDAYRRSLHPDLKTLSQNDLVERYRITRRQAGTVQSEVRAELDAEAAKADASETVGGPDRNGQGAV